MTLSILSVGYPFACVGLDAVGGSEQILAQLDRSLTKAGHLSHVIAPAGSHIHGQLHALPMLPNIITPAFRATQHMACALMLRHVIQEEAIDLVHFHGLDFEVFADCVQLPALATLHLPPDWYNQAVFENPNGPWLLPVSETQAALCPPSPRLLVPLSNGVPDELFFEPLSSRTGPAIMLARICPEKGPHLALQAAHEADLDLVIAGQVYPYPEHQHYFETQISPLLDSRRRFIGPVGFVEKLALLREARCILIPSLVAETSSLVVREAAAMGCPAIAFPQGHLAYSILDQVTGFLVRTIDDMVAAFSRLDGIDGMSCRRYAQQHFSGRRMVADHLDLYATMAQREPRTAMR